MGNGRKRQDPAMNDHDDDEPIDDADDMDREAGDVAIVADPVFFAIAFHELIDKGFKLYREAFTDKTKRAHLKALARAKAQAADAIKLRDAARAETEQTKADDAVRAAALDAQAADLSRRKIEFETSLGEAYATLRASHDNLSEVDRRLRYHVLASADLLHQYNPELQSLPDWPQIRQMVPGLPPDPPSVEREEPGFRIDTFADTFSDPNADRHGNTFLGTLSRDVSHKGAA
jgi:hypothetical protein